MQFIYIGTEDAANPDGTEAYGLWFPVDEPVSVSDPLVIAKLSGHPHFRSAKGKASAPAEPADDEADPIVAKGRAARLDGKARSVPVAYRGKPQEAAWLAGYDGAEG